MSDISAGDSIESVEMEPRAPLEEISDDSEEEVYRLRPRRQKLKFIT